MVAARLGPARRVAVVGRRRQALLSIKKGALGSGRIGGYRALRWQPVGPARPRPAAIFASVILSSPTALLSLSVRKMRAEPAVAAVALAGCGCCRVAVEGAPPGPAAPRPRPSGWNCVSKRLHGLLALKARFN